MSTRRRRVLIAGGGVAGLECALALRRARVSARIQLVTPSGPFPWTALGVGAALAPEGLPRVSLEHLLRHADVDLVDGELATVAASRRVVHLRDRRELSCDALVLAHGRPPATPPAGMLTLGSPPGDALLRRVAGDVRAGLVTRLVLVVPRGVTWPIAAYDVALAIAALAREGVAPDITIITHESAPMSLLGARLSGALHARLAAAGVRVFAACEVREVRDGELGLDPRGHLPGGAVLTLPLGGGHRVPGLPHDARGFLLTDAQTSVGGASGVFAIGDAGAGGPRHAAAAAAQGQIAARAIRATLAGRAPGRTRQLSTRELAVGAGVGRLLAHAPHRALVDVVPGWWRAWRWSAHSLLWQELEQALGE